MSGIRPLLLMLCWLLAYTLGPVLHNPTACARNPHASSVGCCATPVGVDVDLGGPSTASTTPESDDVATDCPFCRILSVPYQAAEPGVQASRNAERETRLAFRRAAPVFSRFVGFSFGARAPPSV